MTTASARVTLSTLLALTALALAPACADDRGDDEVGEEGTESESESESESGETGTETSTETGTETDAGTETDTGTETETDAGETETETDAGETETGTSTGATEDECLDGELPFAGSLCGPEPTPCAIAEETQLDGPSFRNGAPAIALGGDCQPHVLFSRAVGEYTGHYATDDGMGWTVEDTPMPMAVGGLVVEPASQQPTALIDDGGFGLSIWSRDGGWSELESIPGQHHFNHALARDTGGLIHAGYRTADEQARYGVWDGQSFIPGEATGPAGPHVALAVTDGAPWLAAWGTDSQWQVVAQQPGGLVEVAADYGSSGLETSALALAVSQGRPHILHTQSTGEGERLAYSSSPSANVWGVLPLAANEGSDHCVLSQPEGPDIECAYDYVTHHPIAIAASESGEVRMFWTRIHHTGTYVSECAMMGLPFCDWQLLEDTSTGALWVAWAVDAGVEGYESAELGPSFAYAGTVAVDAAGRMHLAVYDRPPTTSGSTTRYIRVAP